VDGRDCITSYVNAAVNQLITMQQLHTEREVVVTGCVDTSQTHNLAAKSHNACSVLYVTWYLCSATNHHVASSTHAPSTYFTQYVNVVLAALYSWTTSYLHFFLLLLRRGLNCVRFYTGLSVVTASNPTKNNRRQRVTCLHPTLDCTW